LIAGAIEAEHDVSRHENSFRNKAGRTPDSAPEWGGDRALSLRNDPILSAHPKMHNEPGHNRDNAAWTVLRNFILLHIERC
jgi:hypothetical protein